MEKYTVGKVIDIILNSIPDALRNNTVDTLKSGSMDSEVKGIISAFTVTMEVIQKAKEFGANFIITHEPTYYNHEDKHFDYLHGNPIYLKKKKELENNNIAVWRFHDNWHKYVPDGILTGTLKKLKWGSFQDKNIPFIVHKNEESLSELVNELKTVLKIDKLKVIGDSKQRVKNIVLLLGSPETKYFLQALSHPDIDTVIGGEFTEWGVGEYTRDAISQGKKVSLIELGHLMSEQYGMEYFAEWLSPKLDTIPIRFVEIPNLFTSL
ncbi:MAG TPA: Nif3-like dinuclear metal center hexameric protein [Victivallales bacterium]|nr:Nif3-like dinuclear metal center hexameric protein [Victivallales bacterium]